MRKKLNEWTKFGYKINILTVIFFISIFFWFNFVSCEDTYIGKSKEEIEKDMIEVVTEVDSLLSRVKWMADSLGLYNDFYINAQRINNGSN